MIKQFSLLLLCSTTLLVSHPFAAASGAQDFNDGTLRVIFTPPDEEQPRTSTGGGSRGGECATNTETSSVELVPITPPQAAGLTTSTHPSIYIYVGETQASKAFFSLKDHKGHSHYYTWLELPQEPGLIKIDLPEDSPELSLEMDYWWYFSLLCEGNLRPDSPTVTGHIKRVTLESRALSPTVLAATRPSAQKAALYSQAGIWYEAVATLIGSPPGQGENATVTHAWDNLLTSAGLEQIPALIRVSE